MRRTAALAVVSIILLAGCGDPTTSDGATASLPLSTEDSSSSSSTSSASSTSTVTEARPVAPDFTLGLGDGGTFVLSEEARPIYLVFWAEW
jgi:hypothetical protein